MIVSLLRRQEKPFFVIDSSDDFPEQFRYAVKLFTEDLNGSVILCDNFSSIEVCFTGSPDRCYHLREVILKSLSTCVKVLQYDENTLGISANVRCNREHIEPANDDKPHPIVHRHETEIGCSKESGLPIINIDNINERQRCWLKGKSY